VIVSGVPFGEHQQDNVVFHKGRLYWGSGSTCDACTERDRRSAAVLSLRPDGSDLRVEARGLRNPYGLAFQPGTGRLYASVNGQDELGTRSDPEPAEMAVVVRRGAFYGWPRCWPNARTLRLSGRCAGVAKPAAYLEPHSSADGIAFWRGDLFVAEWGQYLSHRFGRRVVRVELRPNGTARRVTSFASGFAHPLRCSSTSAAGYSSRTGAPASSTASRRAAGRSGRARAAKVSPWSLASAPPSATAASRSSPRSRC
jgi:glucose/arabinose dehydrogenase